MSSSGQGFNMWCTLEQSHNKYSWLYSNRQGSNRGPGIAWHRGGSAASQLRIGSVTIVGDAAAEAVQASKTTRSSGTCGDVVYVISIS